MIEELFTFLEIDYEEKYKPKMKGCFSKWRNEEVKLPKIKENNINEDERDNKKKKSVRVNIGKRFYVKDMIVKKNVKKKKKKKEIYIEEVKRLKLMIH